MFIVEPLPFQQQTAKYLIKFENFNFGTWFFNSGISDK
jgi:hypothetical protein